MPADYKSTLEELVTARNEARETLKELHGLLKDCKQAKAEIRSMLNHGTAIMVLECINESMDREIEKIRKHLEHNVEQATVKVMTRFDSVARHLEEREDELNGLSRELITYLKRNNKEKSE
jgi:tartrate dehydratase alpha subunit/fumarate hydratase class I-like protein